MEPIQPGHAIVDEVIDVRRHLHANPEVSFEEFATTQLVRERLAALGLEGVDCPTETGAVAILRGGRPGRTVMLRADIDALPILEEADVAFASRTEGRMHACGHDAHTAIMLGVARLLAESAENLRGQFLFVFQPAEEIVAGARAMLEHGLFRDHRPDVAIGLHVGSWIPSGAILTRPGTMWSGSDAFEVVMTGPGGHGGMMGRHGNVISAQAFLVERLLSIVEGLEMDGANCHATIGDVRTDGLWNVVPRRAVVKGSVRTFTAEMRAAALEKLRDLLTEIDTEFAISSELRLVHGTVPLVNDPVVTATVMDAARSVVGEKAAIIGHPLTVSDDMAEFLVEVPGCYFTLGVRPPDAEVPPAHHSPTFRIDEAPLASGVSVLATAAAELGAVPGRG